MPPPAAVVSYFEMAITPDDLRRLAPHLPGLGDIRTGEADVSSGPSEGREWRVRLVNARSRSFGRLRLPVADVEITTLGYEDAEREAFLERFHFVFRRGGG